MLNEYLLEECYRLASQSTCAKAKVGSVIMNYGHIVGRGFNQSPNPDFADCEKLCAGGIRKGVPSGACVEKCYAGHAEQYAIIDAGPNAKGGVLYVARYDSEGKKYLKDPSLPVGDPRRGFYCTVCARFIWMAQLKSVCMDGVDGPFLQSLDDIWNSSYLMVGAQ